jgi:hypothetical protein
MDKLPLPGDQPNLPCTPNGSKEKTLKGMCSLHMLVPMSARRNAKLAAVASGIPFREYVTYLLSHAQPLETARCSDPEDVT